MSTQTVFFPEVEFEALLNAWEQFLEALVDSNGVPGNGHVESLEWATRLDGASPLAQLGGVG